MRILTVIATLGMFAISATAPAQAGDQNSGHGCFPKSCYDR